jgi:hypothetical protein
MNRVIYSISNITSHCYYYYQLDCLLPFISFHVVKKVLSVFFSSESSMPFYQEYKLLTDIFVKWIIKTAGKINSSSKGSCGLFSSCCLV